MKYLDEYRDHKMAKKLVDEIRRSRDQAVGDHGGLRRADALDREVRARLPAAEGNRAGARPGLPGLRDAAGDDRPRARHRAPARRDLLLVRRHAARARLRRRSVSGASRRAPTCGSSTRRSIACGSRASNPEKKVVFFAIGFETTAPANAMAVWQARAQGIDELFAAGLARDLVPPAMTAILQSPENRVQASWARGTCAR